MTTHESGDEAEKELKLNIDNDSYFAVLILMSIPLLTRFLKKTEAANYYWHAFWEWTTLTIFNISFKLFMFHSQITNKLHELSRYSLIFLIDRFLGKTHVLMHTNRTVTSKRQARHLPRLDFNPKLKTKYVLLGK